MLLAEIVEHKISFEQVFEFWCKEYPTITNTFQINNGWCAEFCLFARCFIPQVILISDYPEHAFLKLNNRFHDAENLQGVDDWRDMVYYTKHMLIKNRIPDPKEIDIDEFCKTWGFDISSVEDVDKEIKTTYGV